MEEKSQFKPRSPKKLLTETKREQVEAAKKKIEIKDYISKHEINKAVGEMLNSVIQSREKNPYIFMIKYLSKYITDEEKKNFGIRIDPPYPIGLPIVFFPQFSNDSNSLLKKHLDKLVWNEIKYQKTKTGININDLTSLNELYPSDRVGCFISDEECLEVYKKLFFPLIADLHNVYFSKDYSKFYDVDDYSPIDVNINKPFFPEIFLSRLSSIRLCFVRNLTGFPFNLKLTPDARRDIMNIIKEKILELMKKGIIPDGEIIDYTENSDRCENIVKNVVEYDMEKMTNLKMDKDFPNNRCIYTSKDSSIIILVNFMDHFTFYASPIGESTPLNENDVITLYNKTMNIMRHFSIELLFSTHQCYGFLGWDLRHFGAGMIIYFSFRISKEVLELKLNDNKNFINLIKGQLFESFSIKETDEGAILSTEISFKLHYHKLLYFFSDCILSLSGLLSLDNYSEGKNMSTANKLSFKNIEKTIAANYVKKSYSSVYEQQIHKISFQGTNINDIISKSNEDNLIFSYKTDYITFYDLVQQYLFFTQKFNCNFHDHINKPERKEIVQLSLAQKDYDKLSNLQIVLVRNYDMNNVPFNVSPKEVESLVLDVLKKINEIQPKFGTYYSLVNNESSKIAQGIIKENNLPFSFEKNVRINKGIIKFSQDDIYAIVNDGDHLKFVLIIAHPRENYQKKFNFLLSISEKMKSEFGYVYNQNFGFLTSNAKYLGTGLKIGINVKMTNCPEIFIEHLISKVNKTHNCFCTLSVTNESYSVIKLESVHTIGLSEFEVLMNLMASANYFLEKDVSYNKIVK